MMTQQEFEKKHPQLDRQIKRDHEFRRLSNYMLSQCNDDKQTIFKIVINPNGVGYCHVLGEDSVTIDINILPEDKSKYTEWRQSDFACKLKHDLKRMNEYLGYSDEQMEAGIYRSWLDKWRFKPVSIE